MIWFFWDGYVILFRLRVREFEIFLFIRYKNN